MPDEALPMCQEEQDQNHREKHQTRQQNDRFAAWNGGTWWKMTSVTEQVNGFFRGHEFWVIGP